MHNNMYCINKTVNSFLPRVLRLRKRRTILAIVIIVSVLMILQMKWLQKSSVVHRKSPVPLTAVPNKMSCYDFKEDSLPSVDELIPSPWNIHFIETSCRGRLDSRQACAVESAARAHPEWDINVLFAAPVNQYTHLLYIPGNDNLKTIQIFGNVKLARIHVADYAKGTPLEGMIANTSDILRYLTIYKLGGVYLDLDVVIAKPLTSFPKNFVARESDSVVAAGVFRFWRDAVGTPLAEACLQEIKKDFTRCAHDARTVITRALKNICTSPNVGAMSRETCRGVEIYGPKFFYPIGKQQSNRYFEPGEQELRNAYVYHFFNNDTQDYKIHKNSPYAKLAEIYCPFVYSEHASEFGNH